MFRALTEGNIPALCNMGQDNHTMAVTILSLNHALRHPLDLGSGDLVGLSQKLSLVENYCWHLVALSETRPLCDSPDARKLTGFRPATGRKREHLPNEFRAVANSYAKRVVDRVASSSQDGSIQISGKDLNRLLRDDLQRIVQERLVKVHLELLDADVLRPCLGYLLHGGCRWESCRNFHPEVLSKDIFSHCFCVHMQIVTTLNYLRHVPLPLYRWSDVQSNWMERIFTIAFPMTRMFGDHTLQDIAPRARGAIRLIQNWIEHCIRKLDPCRREDPLKPFFVTNVIRLLLMAHVFHSRRPPPDIWHDLKIHCDHSALRETQTGCQVLHDAAQLLDHSSQDPASKGASFLSLVFNPLVMCPVLTTMKMGR